MALVSDVRVVVLLVGSGAEAIVGLGGGGTGGNKMVGFLVGCAVGLAVVGRCVGFGVGFAVGFGVGCIDGFGVDAAAFTTATASTTSCAPSSTQPCTWQLTGHLRMSSSTSSSSMTPMLLKAPHFNVTCCEHTSPTLDLYVGSSWQTILPDEGGEGVGFRVGLWVGLVVVGALVGWGVGAMVVGRAVGPKSVTMAALTSCSWTCGSM